MSRVGYIELLLVAVGQSVSTVLIFVQIQSLSWTFFTKLHQLETPWVIEEGDDSGDI